jgi:hypothetical protein
VRTIRWALAVLTALSGLAFSNGPLGANLQEAEQGQRSSIVVVEFSRGRNTTNFDQHMLMLHRKIANRAIVFCVASDKKMASTLSCSHDIVDIKELGASIKRNSRCVCSSALEAIRSRKFQCFNVQFLWPCKEASPNYAIYGRTSSYVEPFYSKFISGRLSALVEDLYRRNFGVENPGSQIGDVCVVGNSISFS